jgi:hypothetical protein
MKADKNILRDKVQDVKKIFSSEKSIDWKKYFKRANGAGYLATSNKDGEVDVAVYAWPHIMPDGTIAFGMADRLTHLNLLENPHGVYACREKGYKGIRLFLERVREETEGPVLEQFRQEADEMSAYPEASDEMKFVEYFRVTKALPLVQAQEKIRWEKYFFPMPV